MSFNIRRIVELVWLGLAAVCAVEFYLSFRQIGLNGDTWVFLVALAISLVMYFIRRRGRLAHNNQGNKDGEIK